jgi:hypothetical protein
VKRLLLFLLALGPSLCADEVLRFVAIDNICAWPNLTLLPDGSINTTIFGQPSHGQMAGVAECWNSKDGQLWSKVGIPAPNELNTNRMNVACELAKNGDLLVLCSGWTDVKQPQRPKQPAFRDDILMSWVCRTSDGGKFTDPTKSAKTTLLHLGGTRWMAAARSVTMETYLSEDNGVNWGSPQIVTAKNEINGHLLRLKDVRILLAYGNRIKTGDQLGVLAKFSNDKGKTWGEPIRIAHTTTWDCGYPSTFQRADGKLVTAWYPGASEYHARYHMGVAIWDAPKP